jgi:arabinofuranan 3-O-arabinosyltransferase
MTTESTATPTAQRAAGLRTGLASVNRALSPLSLKWFGWAIAATPALITAYLLIHRLHGHVGTNQPIGTDLVVYWNASRELLMHQPVYASHIFVYPPGSLLLFWPLGLLNLRGAVASFFVVDAAAILLAGVLMFRLFSLPLRSPQGAVTLFLFVSAMPVQTTLFNGNVNGLILLLFSGYLLLASRQQWARAALCLGASFAVKPILIAVALVFGLRRRWPSLLIVLGFPVIVCLAVLPLLVDGAGFVTQAVPLLVGGDGPTYQGYNVSLAGTAASLHAPSLAVLSMRALVLVAAAVVGWRRARRHDDVPLLVVELSGLLVLLTLLDSSFAWPYYTIYLLPLFVSVFRKGSFVRSVPAMVGFFLMLSPDILLMQAPHYDNAGGIADILFRLSLVRQTVGMLLLLGAIAWHEWRNRSRRTVPVPSIHLGQREAMPLG